MNTSKIALAVVFALPAASCVEDGGVEVSAKRGVPADAKKAGDATDPEASKAAARPSARPAAAGGAEADPEVLPADLPARPPVALDAKSFQRRRDPFLSFVASELVVPEPDRSRSADRTVEMPQYSFEDLKLIAIVDAGRGMKPRALFVASDGKSHSIKQGEYFSSAEVLLAAVNRDYVEIEVVDDDLASSLNLQRGERRAIYLRNE